LSETGGRPMNSGIPSPAITGKQVAAFVWTFWSP
jgi:hypothetical protein